jgi:hypothetical protein
MESQTFYSELKKLIDKCGLLAYLKTDDDVEYDEIFLPDRREWDNDYPYDFAKERFPDVYEFLENAGELGKSVKIRPIHEVTIEDIKQYSNHMLIEEIRDAISQLQFFEDEDRYEAFLGHIDDMLDIVKERLGSSN